MVPMHAVACSVLAVALALGGGARVAEAQAANPNGECDFGQLSPWLMFHRQGGVEPRRFPYIRERSMTRNSNGVYFMGSIQPTFSNMLEVFLIATRQMNAVTPMLPLYVGKSTQNTCSGLANRFASHVRAGSRVMNYINGLPDGSCVYYRAAPCRARCDYTDSYVGEAEGYLAWPGAVNDPGQLFNQAQCNVVDCDGWGQPFARQLNQQALDDNECYHANSPTFGPVVALVAAFDSLDPEQQAWYKRYYAGLVKEAGVPRMAGMGQQGGGNGGGVAVSVDTLASRTRELDAKAKDLLSRAKSNSKGGGKGRSVDEVEQLLRETLNKLLKESYGKPMEPISGGGQQETVAKKKSKKTSKKAAAKAPAGADQAVQPAAAAAL